MLVIWRPLPPGGDEMGAVLAAPVRRHGVRAAPQVCFGTELALILSDVGRTTVLGEPE